MTCKRCGIDTPRLTLTQRYCPLCQWDVDARLRQSRPETPGSGPAWLRRLQPKDFSGSAA